ncbi:MAG: ribosome silencing factor [Opitutaceae bacterium]|jgi:ribosome-associated protein
MNSSRSASPALATLKLVCRALDDKKAEDLRVLDVSAHSSITDFLVLATGTSEPHLRALRVELEKVLDAAKVHIVGMDAAQASGWMVVDAFDVMVHFFTPEKRKFYRLETLWKDAIEVSVPRLLDAPTKSAMARAKPARASAKGKKKTPMKKAAPRTKRKSTAKKP